MNWLYSTSKIGYKSDVVFYRPVKKRRLVKAVARPSSKQLQHEDNEAAWNELRHIKNENKNLLVIK